MIKFNLDPDDDSDIPDDIRRVLESLASHGCIAALKVHLGPKGTLVIEGIPGYLPPSVVSAALSKAVHQNLIAMVEEYIKGNKTVIEWVREIPFDYARQALLDAIEEVRRDEGGES